MINHLPRLQRPVPGLDEEPKFEPGEKVRVRQRFPIGHYRVPTYLRGHTGTIVGVITPSLVDNEEEGYGRNAGNKRHYYRISVPLDSLWPRYTGAPTDELRIEIYETWLERA